VSDRPPVWAAIGTFVAAVAFIGGMIVAVPYALTGWQPSRAFLGLEPLRWIGAAMIVLAFPVLGDFLLRFVREGHGTPMPLVPPRRLVTGGAFRWVRNPGYLGAIATLFGQALLLASVPVLIYTAAMALAFHLFVVGVEEPALRRTFGPQYEAYRRAVPRWWPKPPRRNDPSAP